MHEADTGIGQNGMNRFKYCTTFKIEKVADFEMINGLFNELLSMRVITELAGETRTRLKINDPFVVYFNAALRCMVKAALL